MPLDGRVLENLRSNVSCGVKLISHNIITTNNQDYTGPLKVSCGIWHQDVGATLFELWRPEVERLDWSELLGVWRPDIWVEKQPRGAHPRNIVV